MTSTSSYDIYKGETLTECTKTPTETTKDTHFWLYARNNKYHGESIDHKKIGKWMIFSPPSMANETWNKVKAAVKSGDLWDTKISTTDPLKKYDTYAIMIYTKDYTDLKDVISVLNFLESSGIKPADKTIRYKTDQQTYAGIYAGGGQRPWIYSSDTINSTSTATGNNKSNGKVKQRTMDAFLGGAKKHKPSE